MNFSSLLEYDELANFSFKAATHTPQNLNAIIIHDFGRYFLLEPNFRITKIPTKLWLEKASGKITEKDLNEKEFLLSHRLKSSKGYSSFMGFLNFLNHHFLVLVDQAVLNCQIEGHDIYSPVSIDFLPFDEMMVVKQSPDWKLISKEMEIVRNLLSFGFYFSFTYELTLNTDKIAFGIHDHEPKFWWNCFMLKDLRSQNISKSWQIPFIQGFIKNFAVYLMGKKLEFYLISRKSCKKAGTRYNARGVDDEGYVANFVETEQIIYYSFYKCSFVQVRGSVPLFWEQVGITAAVRFTRSLDLSLPAFLRHFDDLSKSYKRVLCVNLMAAKKKSELALTENFELLIKDPKLDFVKYEYFDFHFACKGQKYENVDFLIEKLEAVVESLGFFAAKIKQDPRLIMRQQGVLRVNCLDCLDRTNIVMTKFAALMFQHIMRHMNTDLSIALGEDFIKLLDIPMSQSKKFHPFVFYFKNAWADNGDFLSVHYAGTGSTTSTITRTSKVGFLNMLDHGMKSIERFYINNFEDHIKQEAINIVLGQNTGDLMSKYEETLESQLLEKRHEYIAFEKLKVGVLTWNVNNYRPACEKTDLSGLLSSFSGQIPDIIAVGLQEIDTSAFKDLLIANETEKLGGLWQSVLKFNIHKLDNYYEVSHLNFYGCFLIVFAKIALRDRIKKIQFDEVNFSAIANFSRKGALLIKMNIDDSSLCFINCHFEAGDSRMKDRIQNFDMVHTAGFNGDVESFEYRFLFGDLNFRLVGISDQEIRRKLARHQALMEIKEDNEAVKEIKDLMANDEFWEMRKVCRHAEKYLEMEIAFPPTYKFEKESDKLENGKSPAWCDRVMAWVDEDCHLGQFLYERKEVSLSQHRPVSALYEIEVKSVDQSKKGKIIQDYIVRIEREHPLEEKAFE